MRPQAWVSRSKPAFLSLATNSILSPAADPLAATAYYGGRGGIGPEGNAPEETGLRWIVQGSMQ